MNGTRFTPTPRLLARWARMLTPGDPAQCWEWAGRLDPKGYGCIQVMTA